MDLFRKAVVVVVFSWILTVVGCGGGGSPPVPLKLLIHWGERSRGLDAPSSALSVTIVLERAASDGTDLTMTVNRDGTVAAHEQIATSPISVVPGDHRLTARFFAETNGGGSEVGSASGVVTVHADGTVDRELTTEGRVAKVVVTPDQSVVVGDRVDLTFSVSDTAGNLMAVSPGSAVWTVETGQAQLRFSNGTAEGVSEGVAAVRAEVDKVTSVPTNVSVALRLSYDVLTLPNRSSHGGAAVTSISSNGWTSGYFYEGPQTALHILAFTLSPEGARHDYLFEPFYPFNSGINSGRTAANGVNDQGVFVGWECEQATGDAQLAFVSDPTAPMGHRNLPGLGGSESAALSINNSGDIVGKARAVDGNWHACLWRNGQPVDLGPGTANAISQDGFIVGSLNGQAVLWKTGSPTSIDLGEAVESEALGISNTGDVVGRVTRPDGHKEGFLRSDSGLKILRFGGQDTVALAVNGRREVVGYFLTDTGTHIESRAFLWRNGVFYDLTAVLGADLTSEAFVTVMSINDLGKIGGQRKQPVGGVWVGGGFLLSPSRGSRQG